MRGMRARAAKKIAGKGGGGGMGRHPGPGGETAGHQGARGD